MHPPKTLVVIGGGAAGFFCAINAASGDPGLRVIILEKTSRLLSKVRVSGGGRCNVTHACFEIDRMSKQYPRGQHFVKKTFHQFFTRDTIDWFSDRGVQLKTEEDGRMFPVTDRSQTIIDCLLKEAERLGVLIHRSTELISFEKANQEFILNLGDGRKMAAHFICLACGGFAKASQYQWILRSGHSYVEPVPSLFTFNLRHHPLNKLMGVSVADVEVKIPQIKQKERGPLLVTHWGFSGPVILRLSAWSARELFELGYDFQININWLPALKEADLIEQIRYYHASRGKQLIHGHGMDPLPKRLWTYLLFACGIPESKRWGDLTMGERKEMVSRMKQDEYSIKGKTTFKEEFVTAGGIPLSEIDPNTMESRKCESLFFAGEIMDVDGITGGFNFQHAWTSGWIAASSICRKAKDTV